MSHSCLVVMPLSLLGFALLGFSCGGSKTENVDDNLGDASSNSKSDGGTDSGGTVDSILQGKKGIAITLRAEGQPGSWVENVPKMQLLNVYWNYTWVASRIEQQPEDIQFVPVIWGYSKDYEDIIATIENIVKPQIEAGSARLLLGFNEPDRSSQADITVEEALALWPALETAGIPLASPSGGGSWLNEFMPQAKEKNLRVDYLNVHWYGNTTKPQNFINAMNRYHDNHGLPIIITEFAPADWGADSVEDNQWTRAQVLNFAKEVLPWLENTEWILGYAWFPFGVNSAAGTCSALFENDGSLTQLGKYYASVTKETPLGDQSIYP